GSSTPRDPDMDMSVMRQWQAPDPAFREQVYYHVPNRSGNRCRARIHSPSFPAASHGSSAGLGLKVELEWDADHLPHLVQWRMPGAGEHVLGLEPSNCWTRGRSFERENGTLRTLNPGDAIEYRIDLRFD